MNTINVERPLMKAFVAVFGGLAAGVLPMGDGVPNARGESREPLEARLSLAPAPRSSGDVVCGPRCLLYLFRHYGADSDLELQDLIREVQWPDFGKGASSAELEACLRRRGVGVLSVALSPDAEIDWPHPVLVLTGEAGEALGHFVVWLPSSDRFTTRYWSGLGGIRLMPTWKFAERVRGLILTSPKEISPNVETARRTIDAIVWKSNCVLALTVISTGGILSLRRMLTRGARARAAARHGDHD